MNKKQAKLFDDVNDPPLVRAADRVIELREEKKSMDEKLEVQEKNLISLMKKAKKEKIRHGGYLIQIKLSEAKAKISMKEENSSKTKKGKEQLAESVPQGGTKEREN
jgi:hypothetical protein